MTKEKDTFLRSFRPQAKGQPRGEKTANTPTLPLPIEVIATLFVAHFFSVFPRFLSSEKVTHILFIREVFCPAKRLIYPFLCSSVKNATILPILLKESPISSPFERNDTPLFVLLKGTCGKTGGLWN
ncbi:hypothetical protein QNI16_27885 [Cytophagaceae bacterium YF14B1]|uniref:Uncharacterized protein n=1 Tax=Xanthocytophaga flava TaxID=3048013 RepID=A0AAE3QS57_9BACT|nr:hypothetical protein [Xanthocytophaga flavus]MDJ1484350.1 hypothetical protein [Xanthocytophaga flavus]